MTNLPQVDEQRNNYYQSTQQGFFYNYYKPKPGEVDIFDPQTAKYIDTPERQQQQQQMQQYYNQQNQQQYYNQQNQQQYYNQQNQQQYYNQQNQQQYYPQQQPYSPQQTGMGQQQAYVQEEADKVNSAGFFSRFDNLRPDIQYQSITVESWSTIPSDETQYSAYWSSPEAFEPETFTENTTKETKFNDLGWMIAFWVNFAIFFILFIVIAAKGSKAWNKFFRVGDYDDYDDPYYPYASSDDDDIEEDFLKFPSNIVGYAIGLGLVIGLVVNALHVVYILFAPSFYIHFGFFICIVVSIICVIPLLVFKLWAGLVFPVIVAVICLIAYCCLRQFIPISIAVLKFATRLLWKNPTLFIVYLIQSAIQIALGIMFVVCILFIFIIGWSPVIVIYYLFAFYWISYTTTYVLYLITAGVAAQWYFLNGTEYMPKMGVWASTKRAMTTSFGSASFAAFIMAVIDILENFAEYALDSDSNFIKILACIALCILELIRCCVTFVADYGLIYCAIFGIPFLEGCQRWLELNTKRFIGTIVQTCIINHSMSYHSVIFSIGAGVIGIGIGYAIKKNNFYTMIFMFFACFIYTLLLYTIISCPISTLASTLFCCFAECPERLKVIDDEVYEKFVEVYGDELSKRL